MKTWMIRISLAVIMGLIVGTVAFAVPMTYDLMPTHDPNQQVGQFTFDLGCPATGCFSALSFGTVDFPSADTSSLYNGPNGAISDHELILTKPSAGLINGHFHITFTEPTQGWWTWEAILTGFQGEDGHGTFTKSAAVPIPGTLGLFGAGIWGLIVVRKVLSCKAKG